MIFSEIVILSFKSCAFATRVCDTRSLLLFLVCILLVVISVWKHLATFSNAKIREETFFKKMLCGVGIAGSTSTDLFLHKYQIFKI